MKRSGLIVLSIGLILLVVSGYLFMDERSFLSGAELVTGKVSDLAVYPSADGSPDTYCPVIDFETSAGVKKTYEMDVCASPAEKMVGDEVVFYYNSSEDSVQQKGFRAQYFGSTVSGLVGLLFLADGVGILARKK